MSNVHTTDPGIRADNFVPSLKTSAADEKKLRAAAQAEEEFGAEGNFFSRSRIHEEARSLVRSLPAAQNAAEFRQKVMDGIAAIVLDANPEVCSRIRAAAQDRMRAAKGPVEYLIRSLHEQAGTQATNKADEVERAEREAAGKAGISPSAFTPSSTVSAYRRVAAEFFAGVNASAAATLRKFF